MEHAPIPTLVVITLLQLCRAQSTGSTPEWYAANDINDVNYSPKPITELFSTETSFSPENPIVVLTQSSQTSNREETSPAPSAPSSDSTFPPNVIPLSSTEAPSSPIFSTSSQTQSTSSDTQPSTPARISTASDGTSPMSTPVSTESTLASRTTQKLNQAQLPRANNNLQNVRPNQPVPMNRLIAQQIQPQNIQFLLPPQVGNRQQLPPNGQPNYIVLYQQVPQNFQNAPQMPPQVVPVAPQAFPQQIPARPNMMRNVPVMQQPPMPNQFAPVNAGPRLNMPPTVVFPSPQPMIQQTVSQQPNNQTINNQQPFIQPPATEAPIYQKPNNQPPINQAPIYQQPNNQLPVNQAPIYQQPNNQPPLNQAPLNQQSNQQLNNQYPTNQPYNNIPPNSQTPNNIQTFPNQLPNNAPVLPPRPRQKNRGGRPNSRGRNRMQGTKVPPCEGFNRTTSRPTTTPATKTQNPVITIRLVPSRSSQPELKVNPNITTIRPTTVPPKRQSSLVNSRNYERCLNSCRDRRDRICAAPQRDIQINPDTLKGFPSMCHMACHNTFRANPIYGKVTNGRCGKLRTRIQTVDKSKVRRDELKKSQYTIISNVPGTVVELAQ